MPTKMVDTGRGIPISHRKPLVISQMGYVFFLLFFLQKAKMHVDCEPIAIGLRWLGVPFGTRLHKSVSQSSQVSVSRQVIASSA